MYQVLNGHFNDKVDNNSRIFFRMANGWLAATALMEMLACNCGLINLQYYSFIQSFQDFDYWSFNRGWLLNGSGSMVTVMYNQQWFCYLSALSPYCFCITFWIYFTLQRWLVWWQIWFLLLRDYYTMVTGHHNLCTFCFEAAWETCQYQLGLCCKYKWD